METGTKVKKKYILKSKDVFIFAQTFQTTLVFSVQTLRTNFRDQLSKVSKNCYSKLLHLFSSSIRRGQTYCNLSTRAT